MIREWIKDRLPFIATGAAVVAMFLWSWWLIRCLNGWSEQINQYIYQTDRRLESIEEVLLQIELHPDRATAERNA
jgi:hypothetical protein